MVIDFFHDTACPWCRIGRKHLSDALAGWDGPPVTVRYHPFLLAPHLPPEGLPFHEYMAAAKGGDATVARMFRVVEEAGIAAGLTFRFDRMAYAVHTLLSHRLIWLAPESHKDAVVDAVHTDYFEDGRNIGSLDVLTELAAKVGLDAAHIGELLRGDAAEREVIAEAEWARRAGITGVPFFVISEAVALSGAQPPTTLLAAMREAASRQQAALSRR